MSPVAWKWKSETKIIWVLDDLEACYGDLRQDIRPPLEVLVRGVLSQNTSDVNSGRAFGSLMEAFGDWAGVAGASRKAIRKAIVSGGLAEQKSATIRAIMDWLAERDGDFSLRFMDDWSVEEIEKRLTSFKGVGIKTARLTILFGFDRPVFVVDTHVHRVARRLGLIDEKCGREKAHDVLEGIIPPERRHPGHLQMIVHGRVTCKSQRPRCEECVVAKYCVYLNAGD